jgi:hypothetical protein
LFWSAIVESVSSTEMDVYMSHPPVTDRESVYELTRIGRRGANNAWRVVGFVRL